MCGFEGGMQLVLELWMEEILFLFSHVLLVAIAQSPHIPMDHLEKIGFVKAVLGCSEIKSNWGSENVALMSDCITGLLAKEDNTGTPWDSFRETHVNSD